MKKADNTTRNRNVQISAIYIRRAAIQSFGSNQNYHGKYSIVKDSSVDLGVNFKIVQNPPTIKAVSTKILIYFVYLALF